MPWKWLIISYAVAIHLLFYISSWQTQTLDIFFTKEIVHPHQGIDFYSIPGAAYSWLHGGDLTGDLPSGVDAYEYGNRNVYHPFFTIVVGAPLQIMEPRTAFITWLVLHAIIMYALAYILYRKNEHNPYTPLAILFFLASFTHYTEIWNGQYHFLLNIAIFFILLAALKTTDSVGSAIAFGASLLTKPIGFLWMPTLFFHDRWKTLLGGIAIFVAASIPFWINQEGVYFFQSLLTRIQDPIGGPPGIYTLDSLLRYWGITLLTIKIVKGSVLVFLVLAEWRLKPNLFTSLFIWTGFYLLFYDLVFEYHYTTVAVFLGIGVITQKLVTTVDIISP